MATANTTVRGVHEIVFALRAHGEAVEREVDKELSDLAGRAATMMRALAARRTSQLAGTIKPKQEDRFIWDIGPSVDYGPFVEDGVSPGGKGLPKYLSPNSKPIVAWLQSKALSGAHKPRAGSRALLSFETELRDRYMGLAAHIRQFGVKAQPFVAPTAAAMEPIMLRDLAAAVDRALKQGGAR